MYKAQDFLIDESGNAVSGAVVTVRVANATPHTGTVAAIYSDDGVTLRANPTSTASNGYWFFYAADGNYDIHFSYASSTAELTNYKIADVDSVFSTDVAYNVRDLDVSTEFQLPTAAPGSPAAGDLWEASGILKHGASSKTVADLENEQTFSAAQTVIAPASAGKVALTAKGNLTASADVLDIYDSAGAPTLQSWFDSNGQLGTNANLTFKSGTSFTATLDHGMTNNRVITFPDATATLATTATPGTSGSDVNWSATGVLNLPDAGAATRGVVSTGSQNFAGLKTFTGGLTVPDNTLTVQDNSDATKQLQLQLSGISTGTTRTLTAPNLSGTVMLTDQTQTVTGDLTFSGDLHAKDLNAVRYADQFAGADLGEKITAAIADLPATGGTVDARALEGAQSVAAEIADGGKTVHILLGDTRITSAAARVFILTGNGSNLEGIGASTINTSNGTVITHTGTGAAVQFGSTTGSGVEFGRISGLRIVGSASGTHGIKGWLRQGTIDHVIISGYTAVGGMGIELLTSDANPSFLSYDGLLIGCDLRDCTTLVRFTDGAVNGGSNNHTIIGGRYLGAFTTGFLLDNSVYTNFNGVELGNCTTASAIGVDIQGTSQLTTWVGGLIEGVSGAGAIGVKTAAGTLSTKFYGVSITGNTTDISDGSTVEYSNFFPYGVADMVTHETKMALRGINATAKYPLLQFTNVGDNVGKIQMQPGEFVVGAGSGGADPIAWNPTTNGNSLGTLTGPKRWALNATTINANGNISLDTATTITWSDTNIYRVGANVLGTDDDFLTGLRLRAEGGASTANGISLAATSDTNNRWQARKDGLLEWGPGNAVLDTNLYRNAASELKTDDALVVAGTLAVTGATTLSSTLGYRDLTESVTGTNSIAAAESGSVFFLDSGTEFDSVLPSPAAGLHFTFIVKSAPSGANYTITTAGGSNIVIGQVYTTDVNSATDPDFEISGIDVISFVDAKAVKGDRVELFCDGTNWYAYGFCSVFDAIIMN